MSQPMSTKAKTTLEKVIALRELSKQTRTVTTRAQNDLLQALDTNDLADVALELRLRGW